MLIQNDQGGSTWPQMQFFLRTILIFIMYLVAQLLFKSSEFLIWKYRRFKCNLKHLEGSYKLACFFFFSFILNTCVLPIIIPL